MRPTAARALGLLCAAAPLLAQTIVPVEQEPAHTVVFEKPSCTSSTRPFRWAMRRSITRTLATTCLSPWPVGEWRRPCSGAHRWSRP